MKHNEIYMLTDKHEEVVNMEKLIAYAAGSKIAGTAVGGKALAAMGGGITLATIVVMVMTDFKNRKEIFIALLSTVMSSIMLGSYAVLYFGWQHYAHDFFGMCFLAGVLFTCGLPGWVFIRAFFVFSRKVSGLPLDRLITIIRRMTGK